MAIGNVTLPNNVFLAPMSGVSDAPFRRLAARLGAGLVISEMTASQDLVEADPRAIRRADGDGIACHVVQLAGCEARWMAEGAKIAEEAGADVIDINMGCPARHVTGGQSGSALMRDLDHALSLIEATVGAVTVPVTLKMRLGWDDRSINAPELARRAEAAGIRLITVHGRTRCQFYKGRARLDGGASRQAERGHSRRRQRRHWQLRGCGGRAGRFRRRCGDDRPRGAGPALAAGTDCPAACRRSRARPPPLAEQLDLIESALRRDAHASRRVHRPAACAQASRLGARRSGAKRRRRRRSA